MSWIQMYTKQTNLPGGCWCCFIHPVIMKSTIRASGGCRFIASYIIIANKCPVLYEPCKVTASAGLAIRKRLAILRASVAISAVRAGAEVFIWLTKKFQNVLPAPTGRANSLSDYKPTRINPNEESNVCTMFGACMLKSWISLHTQHPTNLRICGLNLCALSSKRRMRCALSAHGALSGAQPG